MSFDFRIKLWALCMGNIIVIMLFQKVRHPVAVHQLTYCCLIWWLSKHHVLRCWHIEAAADAQAAAAGASS